MNDQITITSRKSYGKRIGNSFKKIFTGVVLLIGSIILLIRNENNFIKEKAALDEGNKITIEIESSNIDPQYNGKLIYTYGSVSSPVESLKDPHFGISTNHIKLQRTVEMYQRDEDSDTTTKDEIGGAETKTTTYSYQKKWSDSPIDSQSFQNEKGHSNPTYREYESSLRNKDPILVGDFHLSETFVNKLSDFKELSLLDLDIKIPSKYKNSSNIQNKSDDIDDLETDKEHNFHALANMIYIGSNPKQPEIGDLRITFYTVKADSISIVGQQSENTIINYKTSNGRTIGLVEVGQVNKDTMFANAHSSNKTMTWILRFTGLLLMFISFSMIFDIIVTLAKVVPFISNILGIGTSLVAFVLTLVIGLLTIAIAWLAVRPLIGIGLLVIGIGGAITIVKLKKKSKPLPAQNAPSAENL